VKDNSRGKASSIEAKLLENSINCTVFAHHHDEDDCQRGEKARSEHLWNANNSPKIYSNVANENCF